MKTKTITVKDLEKTWETKFSPFLKKKVSEAKLAYRELTDEEKDQAIIKIIDFLMTDYVTFAGEHRYDQWESGWGENLTAFNNKEKNALVPRYFGKFPINRFNQKFVMALQKDYELKLTAIMQYWLFEKYLKDAPTVYEFGCGTGHNLLRVREINKKAELWGLDWARSSQRLIEGVAKTLGDDKLKAHRFDFFAPDTNFKLDPKGAIFTMLSLEQTGDRYKDFVDYLIKNKPSICVHVEPTNETLDRNHLLDCLSIEYAKKRRYLNGFIDYLKSLEKMKKIKILNIQRSYTGSFYIDGSSIVVWKPL
jgi:hypothetical protein